MIRNLEVAAFFFWIPWSLREGGTVNAVKSCVMGRRRGDEEKCCKYYLVEVELAVRRWDSSAGISTMRRGLCRVFRKDVFKALKCN